MTDYFSCPQCGENVPVGALACPHCGSDESTGWSDEAIYGFYEADDEPGPTPAPSIPWARYAAALVIALLLTALVADLLPWGAYLAFLLVPLALGLTYYWQNVLPRREDGRSQRLYRSLLARARGDEALVERLVEYERQRSPQAEPRQWLEDALERWERDAR
jgi:hypothetical protein